MSNKKLDKLAKEAVANYRQNQSKTFCECAINLMVTDMSIEATIEYLEEQISILKEYR